MPLISERFKTLRITDSIHVGDASLSANAHPLRLNMLAKSDTAPSRDRFAALYDPSASEQKPWAVPYGLVVKGLTIKPRGASAAVLKTLPTSVDTDVAGANQVPCGEIALTIHRISIADNQTTNGNCYPVGTYVSFNDENSFVAPALTYTDTDNDQFASYFKHFIVNCSKDTPDSGFIGTTPPWDTVRYRQAYNAVHYRGQPGAPVVYVDASRSLFANSEKEIYIPINGNLAADGTGGMAIGFVSQSSYNASGGAKTWPAVDLDVVLHTEQVSV